VARAHVQPGRFALFGLLTALVATIVVLAGCGGSSTGKLEGRIVVKDGKVPVAGTQLDLLPAAANGEARHLTTSADGGFAFADVKSGTYRLSFAYSVSGVFSCPLRYSVKVTAGKTVVRQLAVPVVDIQADGTGKLPGGRTVRCQTEKPPLLAYLCQSAVFPIKLFALPPRVEGQPGHRNLGAVDRRSCTGLRIDGRLGGRNGFGWLHVTGHGKQGWISPRSRSTIAAQLLAWEDVALAAATKLPKGVPALGGGLPDLAFTTPRPLHHAGETCSLSAPITSEWLVSIRNVGQGIAPNPVTLTIQEGYGGQREIRHVGNPDWLRGLAPGESVQISESDTFEWANSVNHTYLSLSPYAHLTIDPNNAIKESNEANNEISLGDLPTLTCAPTG
jgi:CARDB